MKPNFYFFLWKFVKKHNNSWKKPSSNNSFWKLLFCLFWYFQHWKNKQALCVQKKTVW